MSGPFFLFHARSVAAGSGQQADCTSLALSAMASLVKGHAGTSAGLGLLSSNRVERVVPRISSFSHTGCAASTLGARSPTWVCSADKAKRGSSLADDLLDYAMAGPKMRKWYGQGERLPRDGGDDQEPEQEQEVEQEEEGDGSAILVTDADTPMGEQVVLQLILARADIKLLVKDTVAARNSYGPYVTPMSIDTSNPQLLQRALKNCGSVVCLGQPGALPQVAKDAGVAHIVLLSAVGTQQQGGFLSSLFEGDMAVLKDTSREAAVAKSGVRYSVIRVASLRDALGGQSSLALVQQQQQQGQPAAGTSSSKPVSREDVASVIVQTLLRPPAGAGRVFQVVSTGPGDPPESWTSEFSKLTELVGGAVSELSK